MDNPFNPLGAALARLGPMVGSSATWATKAHLMLLEVPKVDYFAARIAREPAIRDAISESCLEWIAGRPLPKMDNEQAMFAFDRFRYAHALGVWIRDDEMISFEGKDIESVLKWLLVDSWTQISLPRWKDDLQG